VNLVTLLAINCGQFFITGSAEVTFCVGVSNADASTSSLYLFNSKGHFRLTFLAFRHYLWPGPCSQKGIPHSGKPRSEGVAVFFTKKAIASKKKNVGQKWLKLFCHILLRSKTPPPIHKTILKTIQKTIQKTVEGLFRNASFLKGVLLG
jgi:hypothetical protein